MIGTGQWTRTSDGHDQRHLEKETRNTKKGYSILRSKLVLILETCQTKEKKKVYTIIFRQKFSMHAYTVSVSSPRRYRTVAQASTNQWAQMANSKDHTKQPVNRRLLTGCFLLFAHSVIRSTTISIYRIIVIPSSKCSLNIPGSLAVIALLNSVAHLHMGLVNHTIIGILLLTCSHEYVPLVCIASPHEPYSSHRKMLNVCTVQLIHWSTRVRLKHLHNMENSNGSLGMTRLCTDLV